MKGGKSTVYKVVDVAGTVKLVEALADFRDATVRLVHGRNPYWEMRCVVPIGEVDTTPKKAVERFVKERRAEIEQLRKEADALEHVVRLAVSLPTGDAP